MHMVFDVCNPGNLFPGFFGRALSEVFHEPSASHARHLMRASKARTEFSGRVLAEHLPIHIPEVQRRRTGKMGTNLLSNVMENLAFVLVALVVAIAFVLIAYLVEKYLKKKYQDKERVLSTRKIAMIGVFSAIAMVLHVFDFAVPVLAPPFYKLDFSEIPALIGAFAFGPVAGVMIEFCKILLKLLIKGTSTAFVGDFANFMIGCSFILPASIIYLYKKTRKRALIGSITGTFVMTVFGTAFNAIYLLPTFAVLYHMPMEDIIAMGTAINGHITGVVSLVIICVAPLNLIKGVVDTIVTMLIYKKLSPILKGRH